MELVCDSTEIIHQIRKIKGVNFTPPQKLGDGKHIIAFMDGEIVSSFIYYTISFEPEDKYLMVGYSFTLPEYRGQGLNTLLRKELEKIAVNASIPKILSIPFVYFLIASRDAPFWHFISLIDFQIITLKVGWFLESTRGSG